jgi:hypothetical protein
MGGGFDDRQRGLEGRWAHDEELRFKVTARRNKLLGQWAAKEMGLPAGETEAYAKQVVQAEFEEAGDEDVFRKIRKDFDAKKIARTDHLIRTKMAELMRIAGDQVMAEVKK